MFKLYKSGIIPTCCRNFHAPVCHTRRKYFHLRTPNPTFCNKMNIVPRTQLFRLQLLVLIGLFLITSGGFTFADESVAESDIDRATVEMVEADEGKVLQPRDLSDTIYSGEKKDSSLMWSVILFVFMVMVIAGFWVHSKWGGNGLRKLAHSSELKIRETKALGNRQFLVVVEYGEQRMLLGVAPGMINHLCYLEHDSEGAGEELDATS